MKKRFWIAGVLVLAAVVVAVLFLLTSGGQERPATVIEAVNTVDAHPRPKDDWRPAEGGMAIYGGGQVRTGVASSARLQLLEGVVRLSAESLFTVKESAMRQGKLMTTLFLQEGRLWAHLTASQPHEFTVEAGSAVAAVRDTHFSVKVADGETLLSVAEGQIVLTAQEQSVTVAAGQQATVEPGQPPAAPEPMSDEERALWATEGEMPQLAPPTPTATPTPTLTPTATPVKVDMWVDVYCALVGRAGDLASRNPQTKFETRVQSLNAVKVMVETPSGEVVVVPPYGDVYGEERRFLRDNIQGLPQAGGTYTFTALNADDTPIPGAVASDVYVGGYEPDPPANVQAEVVEAGILVTWQPSPAIPGAFDPSRSPSSGFYQITLFGEEVGMLYGWNHSGRPLPETSHLIPFRRQDFGPSDLGLTLEEMEDGVYALSLNAFSTAPEGTAGQGLECSAADPAENIRIVIEGGQMRVEKP
jgi:hypothetical protein